MSDRETVRATLEGVGLNPVAVGVIPTFGDSHVVLQLRASDVMRVYDALKLTQALGSERALGRCWNIHTPPGDGLDVYMVESFVDPDDGSEQVRMLKGHVDQHSVAGDTLADTLLAAIALADKAVTG